MAEWQRWKNIMKCVPFSEDRLLKWKPPYIVQPKYDGFRCRAMPIETGLTRNEYLLLSSEENIFYSVPHLNEIFSNLNLRSELDGELYCHGMDFNSLSSIVSRTINLHPDYKRVQFHCFDIINDQPQMKRLLQIENLREVSPWIVVSPFWVCETLDDIMMAYDKLIELKYEGIIVRHYMAPYERKRSTMLMKFKPKKDDTYKIVNVVEEVSKEGIPKNRLGALVCKSGDGNLFHVGTGFNDEERERLWNNRETLPGMNAKVQYQHLTTGKQVPRFPVFVEVIDND